MLSNKLPNYTTINLISYYWITPGVRIYLNVDNLFDATYYDRAARTATPRRAHPAPSWAVSRHGSDEHRRRDEDSLRWLERFAGLLGHRSRSDRDFAGEVARGWRGA